MTGGNLSRSAIISADGKYRYHLYRKVADGGRIATFIMLNPSTADGEVDDPTIRKCLGFCRYWKCGELHVVNLFAVRATDPSDMRNADDPVGPDNADCVRHAVDMAVNQVNPDLRGLVVCAWGAHGSYMDQDETVLGWIESLCKPQALGLTRDGHPRHPLYVPYTVELVPFTGTEKGTPIRGGSCFPDCRSDRRYPQPVRSAQERLPSSYLPHDGECSTGEGKASRGCVVGKGRQCVLDPARSVR